MPTLLAEALDLLLDLPELRATFDALPGYTFPAAARAALRWKYRLSEEKLTALQHAHARLRGPGRGIGSGRRVRDGWDLLLELPELRELLDGEREMPCLAPGLLLARRERYGLRAAELVNLLNAHAEAWARA